VGERGTGGLVRVPKSFMRKGRGRRVLIQQLRNLSHIKRREELPFLGEGGKLYLGREVLLRHTESLMKMRAALRPESPGPLGKKIPSISEGPNCMDGAGKNKLN